MKKYLESVWDVTFLLGWMLFWTLIIIGIPCLSMGLLYLMSLAIGWWTAPIGVMAFIAIFAFADYKGWLK